MPYINGNLKTIIAIGGFVLSIVGYAVGYGSLKSDVKNNYDKLTEVRQQLLQAENDPDASPAGAQLRGEIKVLRTQLDEIKQQLNRIENKLDKYR